MGPSELEPLSPVPFEATDDDLAFALRACAGVRETDAEIRDLVADPDVIVTASARAAFDLVLGALQLSPGDEVLFSPTIGKMPDIAREHGLVPVFVDIDPQTLAPTAASVARALGTRARVLVVTHLFGARVDVGPALQAARAHGVTVIEDRAQAFHERRDAGHPDADVVLHSFGTLKTASAFGGGLLRVRDPWLRARVAALHDAWPIQPTADYARVVLGHLAVRWLVTRTTHAAALRALAKLGADVDPLALRIVSPAKTARSRRQRPPLALLAVLARRLQTFTPRSVEARALAVQRVARALPPGIVHLGGSISEHGHWVLPVVAPRPDALVEMLRAGGFHATRRLVALEATPEAATTRLLSRIVYLPYHPAMSPDELARLIALIDRHRGPGSHPERTCSSQVGTTEATRASHRGCPRMQ